VVDAGLKVVLVVVVVGLVLEAVGIFAAVLALLLLAEPFVEGDGFLVYFLVLEFGVVDPVEGELGEKLLEVVAQFPALDDLVDQLVVVLVLLDQFSQLPYVSLRLPPFSQLSQVV
jgi:hypothetical protein